MREAFAETLALPAPELLAVFSGIEVDPGVPEAAVFVPMARIRAAAFGVRRPASGVRVSGQVRPFFRLLQAAESC
jgi:hypothetical protein